MVENRYVGMKSRGVYETPGGAILHFAHRQMESLTMDREVMHLRDALIPRYAELVYYGYCEATTLGHPPFAFRYGGTSRPKQISTPTGLRHRRRNLMQLLQS
jgi:hypothetical protein